MEKNDKIMESIKSILENNNLLTLSTSENNSPHSCTAFYVFDEELNLYIWTDKNSAHSKYIEKNKNISINIADTSQKWGSDLKGLQIKGTSSIIDKANIEKIGRLYTERYPKVKDLVKSPKNFHNKEFESHLLKIIPKKIKVLDEGKFGKEEYKEISLEK